MRFRKLPLYFVVSCSRALEGLPLQAVMQGLQSFKAECLREPMTLETLYISTIVAGSDAWQVDPLAEIASFSIPYLFAEGAGELALGAAFTLLNRSIEREVAPKSAGYVGDYCPLILVLLDRYPTDDWIGAARSVLNRSTPRIANCLTLLVGSEVRSEDFRHVAGLNPVDSLSPERLKHFFRWMEQ